MSDVIFHIKKLKEVDRITSLTIRIKQEDVKRWKTFYLIQRKCDRYNRTSARKLLHKEQNKKRIAKIKSYLRKR